MHVHVRQGEMLTATVPPTADVFARALIMPNIVPPVTTVERLERYRERILLAAGDGFEPLMTFKIIPSLRPEDVLELKAAGAIAGKLYPEGATTNAEDGIRDIQQAYPIFESMQKQDLVLSIHGEDPGVFSLDREEAFLPVLQKISQDFPRLRIVLEHLTTEAAVEAVASLPNVAGTITLHHLELTLDDLLGGELHPHYFCKPVVKRPSDRDALRRAVFSGNPKYFFGSDSAPHPQHRKHSPSVRAGVFSAPGLLPGLAQLFERFDQLSRLENFISRFGAEYYGLPLNTGEIRIQKQDWIVPDEIDGLVPYHAGVCLPFSVQKI